jgi:hypothetical protein
MSTFLQLCQMVARESGTVSGTQPVAVTGQTGRLGKIVFWVDEAWRQIQNRRNAWFWMDTEFSGTTTASSPRYTAASFSLSPWAAWITKERTLSIYLTATGVSDESYLMFMPWDTWKQRYDFGTQTNDRPSYYSVSPAGELCFGPIPDDTYTVRGRYRKGAQSLTANGDIPEMPERFHDLIGWEALLLLQEHDEAQIPIAVAMRRRRELTSDLERDQLPPIEIGGPIA